MINKEIRALASEKCKANSSTLALIFFVFSLISGAISLNINFKTDGLTGPELFIALGLTLIFSIGSVLIQAVLNGPLQYGLSIVIKKNYNGNSVDVKTLFTGFNKFSKCFVLYLLQFIYVFLWSLLFIIPGIVKSIAYSLSYFVMIDNPQLTPDQCITKSKEITQGHKLDLFLLSLGYFGWLLLCVLTLGILYFWVGPKMMTANYIFYKKLVTPNEEKTLEVENNEVIFE